MSHAAAIASARVLLVRHATCAQTDNLLMGRTFDPPLDAAGELQAAALGRRLSLDRGLTIHASPRRRTQQTAYAISRTTGAAIVSAGALDEMDYGSWSGLSFAELASDPAWVHWNSHRDSAQTPAGDTMMNAQQRMVGYISKAACSFPGRTIAFVTHAELIRAALLHYLGASIGEYHRLGIAPGSFSSVLFNGGSIAVRVNEWPGGPGERL